MVLSVPSVAVTPAGAARLYVTEKLVLVPPRVVSNIVFNPEVKFGEVTTTVVEFGVPTIVADTPPIVTEEVESKLLPVIVILLNEPMICVDEDTPVIPGNP